MSSKTPRISIRGLLLELFIYGALVLVYFLLILRFLGDWLLNIFNNNLAVYGILSLVLIVVQAVVLDQVTSFIVERLKRG